MADTTKPKAMEVDKNDEQKPIESQQAHLGVLEEDDEFEEFTVQGWLFHLDDARRLQLGSL